MNSQIRNIAGRDPEYYFRHNFNVQKHRELTTNPDYRKLFNPRGFAILLWAAHDHVLYYKNNAPKIIRYFTVLPLSKKQMLYLLENLLLTFDKALFPNLASSANDVELNYCLDFISIKCDKLCRQLHTDIFKQCYLFDFSLIKRNLEQIPGIFDKLKYLESVRADYLQYEHFPGFSKQTYFIGHCDEEIRKLKKILKYEKFQLLAPHEPMTGLPAEPPLKSAEYIQNWIIREISTIDAAKWKYVFLSEKDFLFFVNLLTGYFTGQPVDFNFTLTLQPRCKTRFCPILKAIYYQFDPSPLKTNTPFLSLLRNLSIFQDQPDTLIYNTLINHAN